jgi:hypothetical protein
MPHATAWSGPVKSDLAVWIAQLPDFELHSPLSDGQGDDHRPRAEKTDPASPEIAVFDHLRPDSFVRLDEFPAVLCREMPAVAAAAHGQVVARVLRADPARPWPHPPWRRRTAGTRISLLVAGTAWFELGDMGEESFSANDSWCLPAGLDHALLEASTDFELLEIEFPGPPNSRVEPLTVPEMLTLFATYSYRQTPIFGKRVAHSENLAGDPPLVRLDDRAQDGWARPWHLQEQGIQCAYLTRGAARLELKGRGVIDARAGTFWLQQARNTAVQSSQVNR